MLPVQVGRQLRRSVSGLWGYLQTDQENSALSSQLPLLPKQEVNQVSDRIQYEVEVKTEERRDFCYRAQGHLLCHHETIRVPRRKRVT